MGARERSPSPPPSPADAVEIDDIPEDPAPAERATTPAVSITTPARVTPALPPQVSNKKTSRKRRLLDNDENISTKIDNAILASLQSTDEDDEIMLFLKSLAPKLRRLSPDDQMEFQLEMMSNLNVRTRAMNAKPPSHQSTSHVIATPLPLLQTPQHSMHTAPLHSPSYDQQQPPHRQQPLAQQQSLPTPWGDFLQL